MERKPHINNITAKETAVLAGTMAADEPLIGWDVSCDSRLFAKEYPGLPVITCGAGKLKFAHSSEEMLSITELIDAVIFTVLFLILETGSSF